MTSSYLSKTKRHTKHHKDSKHKKNILLKSRLII